MSARGEGYVGAGGDKIDNLGQMTVEGSMDNGQKAWITVQKAKVHRNSASVKYLLRRNLYWFVIGLLVISWGALTPSGHYWTNYFLGLI